MRPAEDLVDFFLQLIMKVSFGPVLLLVDNALQLEAKVIIIY